MSFVINDNSVVKLLILAHRDHIAEENNLEFIKKTAKYYFNVADKDFNSWYLHFLKLYWKDVDNVERIEI